jgi:putative oxidoreductase
MTRFSWLLYLPESGYILMALLLIVQGCGPWSVDRWIHQRLHQGDSTAPGVSQA